MTPQELSQTFTSLTDACKEAAKSFAKSAKQLNRICKSFDKRKNHIRKSSRVI